MFKGIKILLLLFLLGGIVSSNVFALDFNGEWLGEKGEYVPEVSFSSTFLTKYIWRGQNLGDDPVIQNDLSISEGGLTLDVSSMDEIKSRYPDSLSVGCGFNCRCGATFCGCFIVREHVASTVSVPLSAHSISTQNHCEQLLLQCANDNYS